LGANCKKCDTDQGGTVWLLDGWEYVKSSVQVVRDMLEAEGRKLNSKNTDRPFDEKYRPELDITPVLDEDLASRYSQLIGMLRWAVELGRADILHEVSLLSSHLAEPREGHLEATYSVFAYLSKHLKAPMGMCPAIPELDYDNIRSSDWSKSIYKDAYEEMPPRMPKPRGKAIRMVCFVDASHANDHVTRRSQTGFIIFCNNAPITWYSKKQTTVETSTFGSEFVAMRIAMEQCKALRYKLRMLGFPVDEPTYMLGDNKSVVDSAGLVARRLNKKHNAICFHAVREAAAAGWLAVGWEPTESNIADIFTKVLNTIQRNLLLECIFYRLQPPEDEDE